MKAWIRGRNLFVYCLVLAVIVCIYGAIPFFSVPSLGSAVWESGFAVSFANSGWPAIRAANFGMPAEAPMVFGFPNAFLESTLISLLHLHAADAYALAAVCWLALALCGSIGLGQMLGGNFIESAFLSLLYLALPIVWWHAGYGSHSYGVALLPLYVYLGLKIAYEPPEVPAIDPKRIRTLALFSGTALLSIFMDGYTYVMFFTACLVIWTVAIFTRAMAPKILLLIALPVILISALLSYLVYTSYVGVSGFPPASMNFFRAWGVDLVMLLIPSRGASWLWDTLGASVARSDAVFFGDASVWLTTFALPLILAGGFGYLLSRRHRFAVPLVILTLVGLYFSLGPSLKINSVRPVDANGEQLVRGALMPAELALGPTGSEFIYGHLPGFTSMRATYRWAGMMFTGLFGLTILLYRELASRGHKTLVLGIILLLVVSDLPDIPHRLSTGNNFRHKMQQIDRDFAALSDYLGPNAVVFFAPPGNDLMINYLASIGNYRTYNIGGDKNVEMARQNWPEILQSFIASPQISPVSHPPSAIQGPEQCFTYKIRQVLQGHYADFVVIPYFSLFYGNRLWPWPQDYVTAARNAFSPTLDYFRDDPSFLIREEKLYAAVSLSPDIQNRPSDAADPLRFHQPQLLGAKCDTISYLGDGWYPFESGGVWSAETAKLLIPLGNNCLAGSRCGLKITFLVFDASPASPKTVIVEMGGTKVSEWKIDSADMQERVIPLRADSSGTAETTDIAELIIRVPEATSPDKAGLSTDTRILGIYLSQFQLVPGNGPASNN